LAIPKSGATRPTSDRVREAMFNILHSRIDLEGKKVLDLFAGSGALGIEAISRGAEHATFVDNSYQSLQTIKTNLSNLRLPENDSGKIKVVKADALAFVGHTEEIFDIAFCDPPYKFVSWDALLDVLHCKMAVLESDRDLTAPDGWKVFKTYTYGGSVLTIMDNSFYASGN